MSSKSENKSIVSTNTSVFNKNKQKLKDFSEQLPKEADLPRVPSSAGLFGLFNYNVTGNDLNRLSESIQTKMIEQNNVLVKTIKEFNTIYDTFSALDKEYIQGILLSIKAAEEANNKAIEGINGVKENQYKIDEIINQHKIVIEVLKNFKSKIDRIEHLAEVDLIFNNVSTLKSKVQSTDVTISNQKQTIDILMSELKTMAENHDNFKELQHNELRELNNEVAITLEKHDELKESIKVNLGDISREIVQSKTEIQVKFEEINNKIIEFKTALKEELNKYKLEFKEDLNELKELEVNDIKALKEEKLVQDGIIAKIDKASYENNKNIEELSKEVARNLEKHINVKESFEKELRDIFEKINESNIDIKCKFEEVNNKISDNKIVIEEELKELKELQMNDIKNLKEENIEKHNELNKSIEAEIRMESEKLRKALRNTQFISYGSIAIVFVLVMMIISGVF